MVSGWRGGVSGTGNVSNNEGGQGERVGKKTRSEPAANYEAGTEDGQKRPAARYKAGIGDGERGGNRGGTE